MAKAKVEWVCQKCGYAAAKWLGRCTECGEWGSMVEERVAPVAHAVSGGEAARPLAEVRTDEEPRMPTGIGELDRVLGGGLVPGSLVLLGGDPGIGKSTITNMVLGNLQRAGHRTLYVSGEESAEQVRLRAERLAPGALEVPVLAETDLEIVLDVIAAEGPEA